MNFTINFFSNTLRTFPSRFLSVKDSGTPGISKHPRLKYCSITQHLRSKTFVLTSFVTIGLGSSFLQHFLSLDRSVFLLLIAGSVDSNLDWYSRTSLLISSLPSFISIAKLIAILIENQLKVTYHSY